MSTEEQKPTADGQTSNVVQFEVMTSKAKAKHKAKLAKERSTAKRAKVEAAQKKAFEETAAKARAANAKWLLPDFWATCRALAGTDWAAGTLLNHILYVWRNRIHKLERHGRDWLAHSRSEWAGAAGLTEDEMKNRALPRLRKYCHEFVEVKVMGVGANKKLWITVDDDALRDAMAGAGQMPPELVHAMLNGIGPGFVKASSSAYKATG